MIVFLYLGPAAGLVALVVALLFASTRRRYGAVLILGLALAAAWFALILLTASTDPNHPDCEDCNYTWGRWWWPPLVAFVLGFNLVGWVIGATAGRFIRVMRARPHG
jgi:uncharacterized integral membrane protein